MLLAAALALGACAAGVPTVTLLGEARKTVGTFRELSSGDRACYATLEDDNGERFEALAGFDLCERGAEPLGRRARPI